MIAWISEVTAERQEAARQVAAVSRQQKDVPAKVGQIDLERLVGNAERARAAIRDAEREDKAAVYRSFDLKLTWHSAENKILVEVRVRKSTQTKTQPSPSLSTLIPLA